MLSEDTTLDFAAIVMAGAEPPVPHFAAVHAKRSERPVWMAPA